MAATMNGGSWSYAVPLEETDGNARPPPERRDTGGHLEKDAKTLQKRASGWDLMSDSETAKQRRTSLRANNSTAGRKRSRQTLRDKQQQDAIQQQHIDDRLWIHRDKLAEIEIQEMEAAGINVRYSRRAESMGPAREDRRASRSVSRARARHEHDIAQDEDYSNAYPGYEEPSQQQSSTIPFAPDEQSHRVEHHFNPNRDSEFRTSDEIAAGEQAQRQQHMVRPSTSRIPVSRISPVPVPQNVVDRDSPLPRSRAGSQNWSGSFDEMQYARKARSGSVGTQVLFDSDPEGTRITPPGSSNKTSSNDEGSPRRARMPKNAAPNGRKASTASTLAQRPPSSHQKKRAGSSSATKRPGSSSGHKSGTSTGHFPPEGEAPWIATMYKPDPRLPPDQQMLPTHKKRMMQEQWEKEGKTGTAYDRDLNLLNDDEFPKPRALGLSLNSQSLEPTPRTTSPKKLSPNGSATGSPWPLSPTKSDTRSDTGSARPGTSGGYKITPTIPNTPTIQRSAAPSPAPVPTSPPATAPPMPHNPTPRVPELDEKQEAMPKKGCCCVMM